MLSTARPFSQPVKQLSQLLNLSCDEIYIIFFISTLILQLNTPPKELGILAYNINVQKIQLIYLCR